MHCETLHSTPKRKTLNRRSKKDSSRCFQQDQIEKYMLNKPPCTAVELMDEVIGVNFESMPDRLDYYRAHLKFIADIQFKFPLGLFEHDQYGSNIK